MFCGTCGMPNADDAAGCVRCGQPLGVARQVAPGGMPTEKPASYLVPAIVSTLCCCLPFGIVSIVFASQVNSKWEAGDAAGARDSASKAKLWFWLAFGIGFTVNLVAVVAQILVAIAESRQH